MKKALQIPRPSFLFPFWAIAGCCLSLASNAQDASQGKVLYETYCGSCHYERVHERPAERSRVKSLADLRDAVARWAPQTRRRFTLDEREAIAQYLNASHYRFEK